MAKRPGLGRGLAALLGEGETPGAGARYRDSGRVLALGGGGVIDLPVNLIRRNPRQPRRAFDAQALEELATSIAAVGVVQPVIVRAAGDGYELIAGERRWRAAQRAGFTVIPAIVRVASDVESLELALIENVVRQNLNPVDEAYALKVLLEDLGSHSGEPGVPGGQEPIGHRKQDPSSGLAGCRAGITGRRRRSPRVTGALFSACRTRAASSNWPAA